MPINGSASGSPCGPRNTTYGTIFTRRPLPSAAWVVGWPSNPITDRPLSTSISRTMTCFAASALACIGPRNPSRTFLQ
jgi:hypothetical protein